MQEPEELAVSAAARSRLTQDHFHRPRIRCGMQSSRRLVAPVESNQQGLTSNAIDALLYAADLAPRDRELRLKAVRQLLAGNRLKEARERFAPAAFETHAEVKWRTAAQTVVDAMDAGNAPRAAELLDQALKAEHEK